MTNAEVELYKAQQKIEAMEMVTQKLESQVETQRQEIKISERQYSQLSVEFGDFKKESQQTAEKQNQEAQKQINDLQESLEKTQGEAE